MEDDYFQERKEKYEELLKENFEERINQKISLRKSKKSEILMSKRVKVLSSKMPSIYEPKIDKQKLSKKVLSLYEEEKKSTQNNIEEILTKYFNHLENTSEKNYEDTYFILDRLLFIISSMNEDDLYRVVDYLCLGYKLFDLFDMYTYINKIHIYQTFKILVNISLRKNKDLMCKLINLTSIKYIYNFLCDLFQEPINNNELICQILLFLMNLLEDNPFIQIVYYKYNIFDLLYEFILNNKDTEDLKERNINHHIITFFSLYIAVLFDENEETYITDKEVIINKLYNLFEYFLTHNYDNKDLLLDVVWGLSNVLIQLNDKDTFIDILVKKYFENILNQLFILIKLNNDFVVPIFRVIGNLTSLKDSYCILFFNDPWASYILELLPNELILPKYKILIIWILHNICAGTNFECLKKYNMIEILINVLKNENNSEVLFHLLKLFYGIINNSKENFWSDDLVDAIIMIIKKDINLKTNFVCCFLCEKIYDGKIQKYIDKLNDIGFKEILENWSISDNGEIKTSANYILDNFYNNKV
jgi:hypothetical protein